MNWLDPLSRAGRVVLVLSLLVVLLPMRGVSTVLQGPLPDGDSAHGADTGPRSAAASTEPTATQGGFLQSSGSGAGSQSNALACTVPGEARDLVFVNKQTLQWNAPLDPGSPPPVHYDTLRSRQASDFVNLYSTTCIEVDGDDQTSADTDDPPTGTAFFYQVGARNPCGDGPLGTDSSGNPRAARSCSGGNAGLEAPNDASGPNLDLARHPAEKNAGSVYLHSGEYFLEQTDLRIPGLGFDLEWTRKYRSREGRSTRMGHGWDFSYNQRVEVSGDDPADRWVHDGQARRDTYVPLSATCWTAEGFFHELCVEPGGEYTLTFPDKLTWKFAPLDGSPIAGRIVEIEDRNLNRMTFAYDAIGKLMTITDTLNRQIQISYSVDGLISTVADFTGRQVQYGYYEEADPGGSAGDLRSCTSPPVVGTPNGNDYPTGKTTTYAYSEGQLLEALNHNLLTITDPLGQTFVENAYTTALDPADPSFDRIQDQTFPSGVISYVYVLQVPSAGNGLATTKTIVNDRAGNVREAFFNAQNQLVLRREHTGRAPNPASPTNDSVNRPTGKLRADDPDLYETRFEYNADSLRTSTLYPNGDSTSNVYEADLVPGAPRRSQGNLRERHLLPGPLGGDQVEIVETFEYDPGFGGCCGTNFVTRHVDGRGNETLHTYDARGNRIQTQHRIPTIVEDFQYNAFGQMTARVLPDNGSGHRRRDEYVYHVVPPQTGYLQQTIVDAGNLSLTTTYEYDAVGNVVRTIDPRGHDTLYDVNSLNQVVRETSREVTDGSGIRYREDTFYDANDNVARVDVENRDDQGVLQPNAYLTTSHVFDALDRRTRTVREVDPGHDVVTEYAYDANDNRSLVRYGEATNGRQPRNTLSTSYDERDLVFRLIRAAGDPGQSSVQYDYDGDGNRRATREGLEASPRVTTFTYDGYDRLKSSTDPMGNVTTHTYDANHNRLSRRVDGEMNDIAGSGANRRLFVETKAYDDMDRPTRADVSFFDPQTQLSILDGLSTTQTSYTDNSDVSLQVDDNGHPTTYTYDTANRRRVVTDPRGNTVTYAYDANSNVTAVTEVDRSDLGNPDQTFVTTYAYDNLDRRIREVDNASNTTTYAYDSRDNRVRETDPRNDETRYAYDGLDRLVQTIHDMDDDGAGAGEPEDILVAQTWDDSSRLASQTDDNGNATRYAYDALDRRIVTQMADGTLDQIGSGAAWTLGMPDPNLGAFMSGYDVNDNRAKITDANGSAVMGSYDLLDRLANRTITVGPGVVGSPLGTSLETYRYDGLSRLVSAQDNDSRATFGYDSLSNVTRETQQQLLPSPPGPVRAITVEYDGDGSQTRLFYPGPRIIVQRHDSLDRPTLVSDDPPGPGATVAGYLYVGADRTERRDQGNTTRLDLAYDGIRRTANTKHSRGPVFEDRFYAWDPTSNKMFEDSPLDMPPLHHVYTYDAPDRLGTSQIPPAPPTQYSLDGAGNRVNIAGGSDPGPYTCDPTLPEPADCQVNQYTNTPFDSRQYDRKGNLVQTMSSPRQFSYDYRDQLVQHFDSFSGVTTTYRYDALGRRIEKNAGGAVTRFYYSGPREIEEQDQVNAILATYVWGYRSNELLQMNRGGQKFFYHADDLGSPRKVTDSLGNVVEQYKYADYGKPSFFDAGGNPIPASAVGNPYLFTGRRFDSELGFYWISSRYLDTRSGRLIQRTAGGAWADDADLGNAFAYLSNNPTSSYLSVSADVPLPWDSPMTTTGMPTSWRCGRFQDNKCDKGCSTSVSGQAKLHDGPCTAEEGKSDYDIKKELEQWQKDAAAAKKKKEKPPKRPEQLDEKRAKARERALNDACNAAKDKAGAKDGEDKLREANEGCIKIGCVCKGKWQKEPNREGANCETVLVKEKPDEPGLGKKECWCTCTYRYEGHCQKKR